MTTTPMRFTLDVTVNDEVALRRAAYERALADKLSEEEAQQYLDPDGALADCVVMLFDPGVSPPGCQIEGSTAEYYP